MIALVAFTALSAALGWKLRGYAQVIGQVRRQKKAQRLLGAYEAVQKARLGPRQGPFCSDTCPPLPGQREAALKLQELHVEVVKHVCECPACMDLLRGLQGGTNSTGPDSGRRGEKTTPARRLPGTGRKVLV